MWGLFIRNRLKRYALKSSVITVADIRESSVILFSVFSRYGDSVIAFKAINEFILANPLKKYIILTTYQALPYAEKIITGKAELYGINKRKSPFKFLRIISGLKKARIDLGFNPWSHGEESNFFLTFAGKFSFYDKSSSYPKEYNLYDRVREYLLLKPKDASIKTPQLKNIRNIVVSPFSTDLTKNLSLNDVAALISQVKDRFPDSKITVAVQKHELPGLEIAADKFIYKKDPKKSEEFKNLLLASDLFIGVDSGPLHIASALGINSIGIFGPTAPEAILDKNSNVLSIRHKSLNGFFCFVRECKDPLCIHALFEDNFLNNKADVSFNKKIILETGKCPLPTSREKKKG